jgi:hypothetical protein
VRNNRSLTSVLEMATENPVEENSMETTAASKSGMRRMARAPKPASKKSSFFCDKISQTFFFFWLGCCREKTGTCHPAPLELVPQSGLQLCPAQLVHPQSPTGEVLLGIAWQ